MNEMHVIKLTIAIVSIKYNPVFREVLNPNQGFLFSTIITLRPLRSARFQTLFKTKVQLKRDFYNFYYIEFWMVDGECGFIM